MRISDWSSDVCSSDLLADGIGPARTRRARLRHVTHGEEDRRQADRNVDPENGMPAGALRERAAGERAERHRDAGDRAPDRSEEHTSELQSLMRNSYAVFCLKKKTKTPHRR